MTKTQAHILELFQSLSDQEKRETIQSLVAQQTAGALLYDGMSDAQRAQLQAGIDQADRGEVVDSNTAFAQLAERFGFARS